MVALAVAHRSSALRITCCPPRRRPFVNKRERRRPGTRRDADTPYTPAHVSIGRLVVFLAVVTSVAAFLHYYLWARLVRDAGLPSPWFGIATGVIVSLGAVTTLGPVLSRVSPRAVSLPISWIGYVWMGVVFFLFLLLLGGDVVRLVSWLVSRGQEVDPDRRVFLSRVLGIGAAAGALGLGGASLWSALTPVAVKHVPLRLSRFPSGLGAYKIVQLTDLHVGPTLGKAWLEDIVRRTNALDPDLIAITGDLVDGSVADLAAHVAPLGDLRARDGVFFVTGNHEYYSGVEAWLDHIRTLGVRVLRNERVPIRAADGFDLAGVDDYTAEGMADGHGMDIRRAMHGRDSERAVVMLAHQPKAVELASQHDVDLMLSGHTHGGQIFPWGHAVRLQQPYVAGLFDHGPTKLYVSCGTGYWGPPMRLGSPAEITLLELRGTA